MPYKSTHDLPESVRHHLPAHAQEIYMKAFNNAYHEYADKNKRYGDDSLEETARKVAWGAVKRSYYQDEKGKWVKKS